MDPLPSPTHRLLIAMAVACLAGPAAALDTEALQAAIVEPALSLSLTQQAALPEAPAVSPLREADSSSGAAFSTTTQTMVWAGRGRMALGFGVAQRWRAPAWARQPEAQPLDRDGQLLLGLSLRTSAHTRLVWQTPASTDGRTGAGGPIGLGEPTGRADGRLLALDLRRSDAYRALVRGSLRMELGHGTALSLKPRGRRIGVALTSQW